MSSSSVAALDRWIRKEFREYNTILEDVYFHQEDRSAVNAGGSETRNALRDEGLALVTNILSDSTLSVDESSDYDVLGNVGFFMAALRRHELTNPEREQRSPFPGVSALAQRIAAGLGVVPRFATAHVNLRNLAHGGVHKSFTNLPDELLFIEYNCLSILAYIRAADSLRRIPPLGVSHPVTRHLLGDAASALRDVVRYNAELDQRLDVDRFFYCIRPYFKPYRVGRTEYRGANAGDFAGINEVDLRLGLCRVSDPVYSSLIIEKSPFMTVEDQQLLQAAARQRSLLDAFLEEGIRYGRNPMYSANVEAFLDVCATHGRTAAQHHDLFVMRFIERPSSGMADKYMRQITASGPPLEVLLRALEALKDKRMATDRNDIDSRFADLQRLRAIALS